MEKGKIEKNKVISFNWLFNCAALCGTFWLLLKESMRGFGVGVVSSQDVCPQLKSNALNFFTASNYFAN